MTGCRCVGDVALSLSNKVGYLSQDTLNNKLSTCKYLHINFCFSCRSSIKTGNDLFISIYCHSTMTKYKFWCQSVRLFQFFHSLRSLSSASVRNGHFLFGLFISFVNASSNFADNFRSRHNLYDREYSRVPREVATRERGGKERDPCRGGGWEIFFRCQFEVKKNEKINK